MVNTDPLNITIGNPGLKPSFTNRLSLNYNSYQVLSGREIYLNGSFSNTYDAIVNNTATNAVGVNTTQYVNLKGQVPTNYNFFGVLSEKLMPLDVNIGTV